MQTTFEKLSSNKVKITFVVESEKFDEGLKKAYAKDAGRFNIPGFRRGKAPMKVIENHYGAGVFYEGAFDAIFPEIYQAALEEHDVKVVDRPELDVQQIGKGQELKFTVEVFVRPDVTLGQYKEIGVEKTVDEVTEDDVNAEIERARERAARYIDVTDRAAKLDDQVNIDYSGFDGDNQFEGGTATGHNLTLGSGSFIPGFEEQLVGATVGQELDVNVTFPEEYHAKELAGKPVVFKVKVNSIQEKEVPALDEEFVKEASEKANTVEEYKQEIRETLTKQAEEKAETDFENQVIETVVGNAQVDIPEAMVNDQIDSMLRDMEMRMMYQGMRLEDFCKYTGQSVEQLRASAKPQAEERVKTQLVIEAIKNQENISAADEEVDKEMEQYAKSGKKSVEEFKNGLSENDLKYFGEMAAMQKTVDFLKENA